MSLWACHARINTHLVRDQIFHKGIPRREKILLAAVYNNGYFSIIGHVFEGDSGNAHFQLGSDGSDDGNVLHRHLLPLC
jgi:hypothetical protein